MTSIIFSGQTAIDYWLWAARTRSKRAHPVRRLKRISCEATKADILEACRLFKSDDSDACVLCSDKKPHIEGIKAQRLGVPIPDNSLCRIEKGVYVVSPELLFVLEARSLDVVALVKLGYELTANFVPSVELFDNSPSKRKPITTIESIRRFIQKASRIHGIKKARLAVRQVLPHAESPREIELAMMLTMPMRLGGYGLPRPVLNAEGFATPEQLQHLSRQDLRPDALWPEHGLVLEYDSDQYHTGAEKIARDSRRRNDLMRLGYNVITVTNQEYRNAVSLDNIYEVIRKRLRLRRRYPDAMTHHALKAELMRLRDFQSEL